MRWFAMSNRFLDDPKVVELGAQHGPAGPLTVVALLAAASIAEDGGKVEVSYRSLAHDVFSDIEAVKEIVKSAVDLGICHGQVTDCHGASVAFPEWNKWQEKWRKARQRAREKEAQKPHGKANVTVGHGASRSVPYITRQDKTDNHPLTPSTGGGTF